MGAPSDNDALGQSGSSKRGCHRLPPSTNCSKKRGVRAGTGRRGRKGRATEREGRKGGGYVMRSESKRRQRSQRWRQSFSRWMTLRIGADE
mmetsp:Transcript_14390/g.34091  ORF Transcript_14390/g.34091 Transcript_14390/m.34091 type:complete len:91 (-) Transcript_14390:1129-1401(-)